ncbi:hypothetical protein [Streptomyces kaniharaensis]|uniref:hypothetical protein n=1 Tax=Streptomyces kaniharaensis TaxID=212423 RepID=UPI001E64D78A|nr:hypothetical protein [Streptomyces kaniharaensis]
MMYLLQAGVDTVHHVAQGAGHILAEPSKPPKFDVNPGTGDAPPGVGENLKLILQWVAWIVFSLCVCGILLTAGKMAISHSRGQGGEHASSLAWVLGACILGGAASSLVGALI